jgi:hypothetical protein
MATKKKSRPAVKPTVKKRSLNQGGVGKAVGAPFNEQDPQRRLGNFEGAGESSRVGGRTSGIVGQKTKQFRTENRKKK